MQKFLVGSLIPFDDIDLENVPPALSIEDANSTFSARAAAAIFYGASTPLSVKDKNGKETVTGEVYGLRILAKMAYVDYFSEPDHLPGRDGSLRKEVSDSVMLQIPGT